jgi:hypothetical protein
MSRFLSVHGLHNSQREKNFSTINSDVRKVQGTNVIAPFATKQTDEELKEARFISVLIDSSNHLDKSWCLCS